MKNKLKLPERYVRGVLLALGVKVRESRLSNDLGTTFHLKAGPCRGVIVIVYDTNTVVVEGKGKENRMLMRKLLLAATAVVKTELG